MTTGRGQAGTDQPAAVSYSIGASSPAGLWLGLTAPAMALLGTGSLLSILAALAGLPLGVVLVPMLLTTTGALLPVAGRPVHAWTGPVVSHAGTGLIDRRRWCPPPPATVLRATLLRAKLDGPTVRAGLDDPQPAEVVRARLRLPTEYGRPVLLGQVPAADPAADNIDTGGPGVLLDRPAGVVTLVFAVAGVDRFALLDSPEQDQLLAGWGSALTLLSRDPAVRRVQLLDRRAPHPNPPGATAALHDIASAPADPSRDGHDTSARVSRDADYLELQAQVRALTVQRDSLLAVQLRLDAFTPNGTARSGLGAGQRARHDAAILTAARERAQHLSTQLLAGQLLSRPLGLSELTDLLAGFLRCRPAVPDPAARSWGTEGVDGVPLICSRRSGWDHVRVDDSWHRSYAVTDWPRTPSTGSWLAPLLLAAPIGSASSFAVHLEPIAPAQAARLARSARTRADLDLADRHKLGLPPSAAADLTAEGAAGMDAELVAGHTAHRLSALLTATAPSLAQLETASRQLQEAALAARLQVRPLHGQHHLALAASLPLCRLRSTGPS